MEIINLFNLTETNISQQAIQPELTLKSITELTSFDLENVFSLLIGCVVLLLGLLLVYCSKMVLGIMKKNPFLCKKCCKNSECNTAIEVENTTVYCNCHELNRIASYSNRIVPADIDERNASYSNRMVTTDIDIDEENERKKQVVKYSDGGIDMV